jgi:hypothetical protein
MSCPNCGHQEPIIQTAVDMAHEPSRHDIAFYNPVCMVRVYEDHKLHRSKPCGKPAVIVDSFFPVEWSQNRCEEHRDWPKPEDMFDPGL